MFIKRSVVFEYFRQQLCVQRQINQSSRRYSIAEIISERHVHSFVLPACHSIQLTVEPYTRNRLEALVQFHEARFNDLFYSILASTRVSACVATILFLIRQREREREREGERGRMTEKERSR